MSGMAAAFPAGLGRARAEGVSARAQPLVLQQFQIEIIRLDHFQPAGHRRGLHLGHGVVDRGSEAFVQDLDAEQLGRGGRSVFVGAGDGDVEGQDLVGVPGVGDFLEAVDFTQRDVIQLIDRGIDRDRKITGKGGVEGRRVRDGFGVVDSGVIVVSDD